MVASVTTGMFEIFVFFFLFSCPLGLPLCFVTGVKPFVSSDWQRAKIKAGNSVRRLGTLNDEQRDQDEDVGACG